jgi:hypothetical protein
VTGANGKVIVLDTWAMLAYLDAEPAAQDVRQMLRRARKKDVLVLFSLIDSRFIASVLISSLKNLQFCSTAASSLELS